MFPIVRTTLLSCRCTPRASFLQSEGFPKKRTIYKDGGKASCHSVYRAGAEEADRRAAQEDFTVRAFVNRRFESGLVEAIGIAFVERLEDDRGRDKDDKDDKDE